MGWFNTVDATYRAELRELNELNFARFDAKLEQRIAEVKAEFRQEIAAGAKLRPSGRPFSAERRLEPSGDERRRELRTGVSARARRAHRAPVSLTACLSSYS